MKNFDALDERIIELTMTSDDNSKTRITGPVTGICRRRTHPLARRTFLGLYVGDEWVAEHDFRRSSVRLVGDGGTVDLLVEERWLADTDRVGLDDLKPGDIIYASRVVGDTLVQHFGVVAENDGWVWLTSGDALSPDSLLVSLHRDNTYVVREPGAVIAAAAADAKGATAKRVLESAACRRPQLS